MLFEVLVVFVIREKHIYIKYLCKRDTGRRVQISRKFFSLHLPCVPDNC